MMLSICLSVCLFVCLSVCLLLCLSAYTIRGFLKLSNLEIWSLLTTNRKSYMVFSTNLLLDPYDDLERQQTSFVPLSTQKLGFSKSKQWSLLTAMWPFQRTEGCFGDRTATGQRSFAVNGPATWNRLPPALRSPDLSESAFKRALKRTCSRPPGAIETSS